MDTDSGIFLSKRTFYYWVKGQASPLPAGWCCLKPKRRGRKYNFEIKVYMASGVVTLCRDFCLEFLHKILVLKIFPPVHFSLHFLPSWLLSLFSIRRENHSLKILLNKVDAFIFLHCTCRLNILITLYFRNKSHCHCPSPRHILNKWPLDLFVAQT